MASDAKRTGRVPLQVLAVGLNRCTTTTVHAMLESDTLGIRPTLHGSDDTRKAHRRALAIAVLRLSNDDAQTVTKRRALIAKLTDGYAGVVADLWGKAYLEDLLDMYPHAKIVLNLRPPTSSGKRSAAEAWADSINRSLGHGLSWNWFFVTGWWPRTRDFWTRHRLTTGIFVKRGLLPPETAYKLMYSCKEWFTPEFYDRYNARVLELAAKRNREVLVWHVGEGWEPLCKFLDKEPPPAGTKIPRLNEQAFVSSFQWQMYKRGLIYWSVMIVALGLLWALVRRRFF